MHELSRDGPSFGVGCSGNAGPTLYAIQCIEIVHNSDGGCSDDNRRKLRTQSSTR